MAPMPTNSGHCEKARAANWAPRLAKPCRGSLDSVTGMPRRVEAASSSTRLCHSACWRTGMTPARLKCVMSRSEMKTVAASWARAPAWPSVTEPSGPGRRIEWKSWPAFSSTRIRPRRSSTLSSTGRDGSS